ncbi:unnamed protein product, partial [Rotaria sp. Silwood1]
NVEIDKIQDETTVTLPKLEDRLDATVEKLVPIEEPHYQLPSSEPVPPTQYSIPEPNTYDTPRFTETLTIETSAMPTFETSQIPTTQTSPLPTIETSPINTEEK